MTLTKDETQEVIAKRVAQEFHNNDVITLGIGLPTKAVTYLPDNVEVIVQSENGVLGVGTIRMNRLRTSALPTPAVLA